MGIKQLTHLVSFFFIAALALHAGCRLTYTLCCSWGAFLLLFLSGEYPGSAFYGATEALIVRGHSQAKRRAVLFLAVFTITGFCSESLYFLLHILRLLFLAPSSPFLPPLFLVSLLSPSLPSLSPLYYSIQYAIISWITSLSDLILACTIVVLFSLEFTHKIRTKSRYMHGPILGIMMIQVSWAQVWWC